MRKLLAVLTILIAVAVYFGCSRQTATLQSGSSATQDTQMVASPVAPNSEPVESATTKNNTPSTPPAEPDAQIDATSIASWARLSFRMESVEGILYDVYIVGENEERLDKWVWRQHDKDEEIWCGSYYAYIGKQGEPEPVRQSVYLFENRKYPEIKPSARKSWQRVNVTYPNRDGFYLVHDEAGEQPNVLVCTVRETGGGAFTARVFVIKDDALQLVQFQKENEKIVDSHLIVFDRLAYAEDGTLAVPWWTNAKPNAGEYTTFYDLDIDGLILRPTNTITRRRHK